MVPEWRELLLSEGSVRHLERWRGGGGNSGLLICEPLFSKIYGLLSVKFIGKNILESTNQDRELAEKVEQIQSEFPEQLMIVPTQTQTIEGLPATDRPVINQFSLLGVPVYIVITPSRIDAYVTTAAQIAPYMPYGVVTHKIPVRRVADRSIPDFVFRHADFLANRVCA